MHTKYIKRFFKIANQTNTTKVCALKVKLTVYIMGKFGVRFVNKLTTNTYDEARSTSQKLFQKNNSTEQLTSSSESEESDESTFNSQKEEENFSQEKSD
ncbi:hypothetical protein M0812_23134 [Anaeramoeba flamelloides]|uniref:Uncharacterized protein n=1 Tax=Anaeramoeba flamelloides TaxID=1746091 RepID=A0AAV7YK28_9EUKA|nr:hypothetical protein M0812_23134 [Anaeramoeba flamelloides]